MKWDSRLTDLKVSVGGTVDKTKPYWRIIAAWLTVNGSWDDVPAWACQWQLNTLGGDHHAFGRAVFQDGSLAAEAGFGLTWPDGVDTRLPEPDGWANIPLYASYDPAKGPGPYSWLKAGNAERLDGLGLPLNHHVSFFAVWQLTEPAPEPPPVEPPVEPPGTTGRYWLTLDLGNAAQVRLPVELTPR